MGCFKQSAKTIVSNPIVFYYHDRNYFMIQGQGHLQIIKVNSVMRIQSIVLNRFFSPISGLALILSVIFSYQVQVVLIS